jgi:hypothetical protein
MQLTKLPKRFRRFILFCHSNFGFVSDFGIRISNLFSSLKASPQQDPGQDFQAKTSATPFRSLNHWNFGFVSDFDIRISNFFNPPGPTKTPQFRAIGIRISNLFSSLKASPQQDPGQDFQAKASATPFRSLNHWNFGFVSDFDIRISNLFLEVLL